MEGRRPLCIYIVVDGNEKGLEAYLNKKEKVFAEQVRSSQCTPNIAMYTHNIYLIKGMEYSNVVSNFPGKKGNKIVAPVLENSLNKSTIAAKFPREVLYGPVI